MRKKRNKKIVRILLGIGIAFLALVALTTLILKIIFPPAKLKHLAISQIENAINRKVELGDAWLNPFTGVSLADLKIYDPAHDDSPVPVFLQSDKILLRWNLFSLVKKEINIYKIQITRPVLNISQDKNLRWNFDDLIAADSLATPDTSTVAMTIPLALKLKELSFENVTANIAMQMSDTIVTIKTGGVSLRIDDLFLKADTEENLINKTRASFKLFTDDQPWEFTLTTDSPPEITTLTTTLKLAIDIDINGLQKVNGTGNIAFENVMLQLWNDQNPEPQQFKFPDPEMASLSLAFATDADQGILSLDHLNAYLAKENIFNIKGTITQLLDQPNINLEVTESEFELKNIATSIIAFLPDSLRRQFQDIALHGKASIKGTKINGNPLSEKLDDALAFLFVLSVDDIDATYPEAGANLDNLRLQCTAAGIVNANGVPKTDIVANLAIDNVAIAVDTLQFSFRDWKLHFTSSLDADFFPATADVNFAIGDFLGAPLTFFMNFTAQDQLNTYQLVGELSLKELPLRNIPEAMMEGSIDFGAKLHSESLDQINIAMSLITDIIELTMEDEPEPYIFSPMDLHANALIATDTTFEKFDFKEITMQVNDFASGLMHGDFIIGAEQKLTLLVDEFKVDHEKVMAIVPAQLLVDLETLKIFGHSNMTANLVVAIPETDDLIIQADGKIKVNAGIDYPEVFFKLDRIDGEIEFDSDGESANIKLNALLDSLTIKDVQDVPLRNMPITAFGHLPDFETFILDSSFLHIPELMTHAKVIATIDSLSGNFIVNGTGRLITNTENQSVSLMNDMIRLNGSLSLDIDMNYVGDIVAVTGRLDIDYLKVDYEDLAQVDSIQGILHFTQKFDIETEKIVKSPAAESFIAQAGAYYYDLLRPYYRQESDKLSHVRIGRINAMDYFATDLTIDLSIQNERIEIPRFSLQAYDGNLSGLAYVNLHEGLLDQIEWRVKANLTRLNSAKLIPAQRLKSRGAELNLNLELSGQGVDPTSQFDIGGYLYVTKIGPQFTDNVLRSLDPKSTDKSIQDTRRLLNWGYKPRLISFEIKHDNLYPKIYLTKATLLTKLIPLNLAGGKIELARIPLKIFLSNLKTETK